VPIVRAVVSLIAIALAFSSAGCVVLTDFDPVGTSATVRGAWTIDGVAPTEESCMKLGASQVRVAFLDEMRVVAHGALFLTCFNAEAARNGSFDTGDASLGGAGPVVADGHWTVRLEAIDGSGNIVAVGPSVVVDVPASNVVALDAMGPVDFLTGTVSASFTIGGAAPTFASCEDAGIAEVMLVFADLGTGRVAREAREPCAAGTVGTRALPGAIYTVSLRALDASGGTVGESTPSEVIPGTGSLSYLAGSPFDLLAL
jgi:hypothetical protein